MERERKTEYIITIGRQYGSGGRQIAHKLAYDLGIPYFDKELLERASTESGLCHELFENNDEQPASSFMYSLVMDVQSGFMPTGFGGMPLNHKVFLAQFDAIRKIAAEGPCVLVGRCADYALAEYKNVVHIFLYGDLETRIDHIADMNKISPQKARDAILKIDKKRANYYNYYTSKKWGDAASYDLSINTSKLGWDGTVKAIENYLQILEADKGREEA